MSNTETHMSPLSIKTHPFRCPATDEQVYITQKHQGNGFTRVRVEWRCSQTHACTIVRASPSDRVQMNLCQLSTLTNIR